MSQRSPFPAALGWALVTSADLATGTNSAVIAIDDTVSAVYINARRNTRVGFRWGTEATEIAADLSDAHGVVPDGFCLPFSRPGYTNPRTPGRVTHIVLRAVSPVNDIEVMKVYF